MSPIIPYGDPAFDPAWLSLIQHDPVHPSIPLEKRITGNRTLYVYVHENVPQFMVCVRVGNRLPHTMIDVLEDDDYHSKFDVSYAIFYSIFRLPGATQKGAGTLAIKSLIAYCRAQGVQGFYTLSPAPQMREHFKQKPSEAEIRKYLEAFEGPVARFHLNNGARIHSINFNADMSVQRIDESWGIMVNYDYNFCDR
jgi:hypothetical protein